MTKPEHLAVMAYLRTLVARYVTRYPLVEGSGDLQLAANKRDLLFSYGVITEKGIESRIISFTYDEDSDQFTYAARTPTGRQSWITLDYDTEQLYQAAKRTFPGVPPCFAT